MLNDFVAGNFDGNLTRKASKSATIPNSTLVQSSEMIFKNPDIYPHAFPWYHHIVHIYMNLRLIMNKVSFIATYRYTEIWYPL
jgi:hypothetical protein